MNDAKTEGTGKAGAAVPKDGELEGGKLWFSRRGDVFTIGLTSRAMDELGDLEGIDVPEEGDHFDAGDEICTIEGNRGSVDVVLPSRGVVVQVNPVTEDLSAVAEDPLEEGWIIKFQVEDLDAFAAG